MYTGSLYHFNCLVRCFLLQFLLGLWSNKQPSSHGKEVMEIVLTKWEEIEGNAIHWNVWIILWSVLIKSDGTRSIEQVSFHNEGLFTFFFFFKYWHHSRGGMNLVVDGFEEIIGRGKHQLDFKQLDNLIGKPHYFVIYII